MRIFDTNNRFRHILRNLQRKNFGLWYLYRRLYPILLFISFLIWLLAEKPRYGSMLFPVFIVYFLWLKTICLFLIWYLFRTYNKKGLYFYYHLGLSEIQLFIGTWLFDICVFLVLLAIVQLIIF